MITCREGETVSFISGNDMMVFIYAVFGHKEIAQTLEPAVGNTRIKVGAYYFK